MEACIHPIERQPQSPNVIIRAPSPFFKYIMCRVANVIENMVSELVRATNHNYL